MKRPIPELLDHDRHAAPNIAPWPPKFLISDFGLVPEDPDEAAALQAPYGTINVEAELELRRSAAEVQNVAAGFGTLDLMKSGGIVRIGAVGAADLVISTGAALATTAIVGFPIIPSCAGTPTGVPTNAGTGKVPMIYDTTANKVWFYNGSWRGIVVV
jgi:hypothetical protein